MMFELRHCNKCGCDKSITEFTTWKSGRCATECKQCRRIRENGSNREKARRLGRHKAATLLPGERFVDRVCLSCRRLFRTSQDYRMCLTCRNNPAKDGLSFVCL